MTEDPRVRVLLVEDHAIVREGVRSLLQMYRDIDVVGEVGDGEDAIVKVETLHPHVVVMDITLPRMDGVAATRVIKAKYPDTAVIGLSLTAKGYNAEALRRAGAYEVLSKELACAELYSAIQQAAGSRQSASLSSESQDPKRDSASG
ncbi:MAG TPA: response regulator transcription factor [Nitrospira sp.]|nr:response regulator transcription factor [Nitrospira sp.]